jgi:mannosyltransferase OCH1-like enzyme
MSTAQNRTLHFCWLLDPWRPSREQYLKAWQDAGWDCVLWHGGQLQEPPVPGVELRLAEDLIAGSAIERVYRYEHGSGAYACCADLFRYLVIHTLGGSYVDIDVLPAPGNTPALPEGPMFGDVHPSFCAHGFEIRFIRAPQGHPLMKQLIDIAVRNETVFSNQGGYERAVQQTTVLNRTGPKMAEGVVKQWAASCGRTVADFTLRPACVDTPENKSERHYARMPHILKSGRERRKRERKAKRKANRKLDVLLGGIV